MYGIFDDDEREEHLKKGAEAIIKQMGGEKYGTLQQLTPGP